MEDATESDRPTREPSEAPPTPLWRNVRAVESTRRRRALAVVGLLAATTVVVLILTVGWLRPIARPSLILLGDLGGSPAGLTSVPYVEEDGQAIVSLGSFDPVAGPVPVDRGIEMLVASESRGPMVVYLVARAWVEPLKADPARFQLRFAAEGKLPTPGRPAEGLSLADLVGSLRRKTARTLLILDIHPPPDDPRLGLVLDDLGAVVATESADLVSKDPFLSILASCSGDQHPLVSEALGRSVFGVFVERGLRGEADASGDGRVTVRELADFVRSRVDRWARMVVGGRQTPALYEQPAQVDWPLALVKRRSSTRPEAMPKEVAPYPTWLVDAWRERDAGRSLGIDREDPRVFDQMEASLLLAERGWRSKLDEARVRSDLSSRMERLRDRIATTRAIPHPRPRSIALEASFGASPDPDILKAVREVVTKRARPTPDAKPGEVDASNARLIADFASTAKVKADFDLASAVFRIATEDPSPSRDTIVFLDRLVGSLQPRPVYVETEFLHRLALCPEAAWSVESSRLALSLAVRGESIQARPAALLGSSRAIDDAARLRHEAEVLLASPGYASPVEVARRLDEALASTGAASSRASTIEEARRQLDRALATLPVVTPLLDLENLENDWFAAIEATRVLRVRMLENAVDVSLDMIETQVDALRASLAPFGPAAVARRIGRITQPSAVLGPSDLREIEALLATPLPTAGQRPALWKVGIDLERRLAEATLGLESRVGSVSTALSPRISPIEGLGSRSRPRRARVSDALLAVVGTPSTGWPGLAGLVTEPGRSLEDRDRSGRLISPWVEMPELDDPTATVTRGRRMEEFAELRRWLADRYAFESRDPDRSDFFAEAARDFREPGDRPRASMIMESEPSSSSLDPDRREARFRLKLRSTAPSGTAQVEVATADDDWLDVRVGSAGSKGSGTRSIPIDSGLVEVPLTITLRPETQATKAPLPAGVLIRVRWNGRTAHHRIPLRIEPESKRPRLIFAASPSNSSPAASAVQLRVARGKVSYSIHVENPSDRDRRFIVEVDDRLGSVAGASATIAVKAGGTSRVTFGPPTSNPDSGFFEVRGPLTIRLTDLDDPGFRVLRTIPVGLASPMDYVRVVSARYDPPTSVAGEKGRLEFRLEAVGPIEGAPCPVELSLPLDRIPGLVSVGEGTFRSKLEKLGDQVTLFVENFELDPRAEEAGFVHLAIDGIERALVYRTNFSRRGSSTIPVRNVRPAVRLKASQVASSTAPLRVDVELDSPPESGRLELGLGQYAANGPGDRFRFDTQSTVDSARGRIRLNPRGPDGSMVFEATVRDPSITVDVGKIRGRRIVRALLMDERGDVKASDELPLVLDDRAPSEVGFESLPRYGARGGMITLKATGKAPDSGIKEVVFFAGRPTDGKRPAGVAVFQARPVGTDRASWSAAFSLADAKLGPLEVSVEFVPGAGPSRFDTAMISVVDAIPVEPGLVRGFVKEGERPQPGFEVRVYDEKGVEKGKATTDDSGQFTVANLSPGSYEIVSAKETPPTRGAVKVVVKAGATSEANVSMFRVR